MRDGIKKTLELLYQLAKRIVLRNRFPFFLQFMIFRFFCYKKGLVLFKKLRRQYGRDCTICICPYKGTGDVYLAAAFFKDSELDKEKNIFCVIGASNRKI